MAASRKSKKGRAQKQKDPLSQDHAPDLSHFWGRKLPPVTPGDYEFHIDLLVPPKRKNAPANPTLREMRSFPLGDMTEQLTWTDDDKGMNGTITLHRPDPADPLTLPVMRGQLLRCRVKAAGKLHPVWTCRCQAPQTEVDTGVVTMNFHDDVALLDTGKHDWIFRKTKKRPHGYYADEIAREIAKKLGVRIGRLAKGTKRITLTKRNTTGLAALKAAYDQEKQAVGRPFIVKMWNGKLNVIPLNYNPQLYVLEKQIQTALLTQKAGDKITTTVLTGTGHIGAGKHAKKIKFTAKNRKVVRAYGYLHDTKDYGLVSSHRELRDRVKRDLTWKLTMNDTADVVHAGLPFILRGDAVQLKMAAEGYRGANSYVFVSSATHTVQSGDYTSEFQFTTTDLVFAQKEAALKAAQDRAKKAGQNKQTVAGGTGTGAWHTVDTTFFSPADAGGAPACGGDFSYNGGMLYAELGFSGGAGQKLGPIFGMSELPCGFMLEVRNPASGRSGIGGKHDTGGGAPGASLDLWNVFSDAIGFTSVGHGPTQIRAA